MWQYRKTLGLRRVCSRKLGVEYLEGRSLPSALTAALLPSSLADCTSQDTTQKESSSALVAPSLAGTGEAQKALLPMTEEQAENLSSSATTKTADTLTAATNTTNTLTSSANASTSLRGGTIVLLMGEGDDSNQPPVISDFEVVGWLEGSWTLSGTVSDPDDTVAGMVVSFGGVLDGYNATAVVAANGTFSISQTFAGLADGYATAQTADPHGAVSNLAECYVFAS